MNHNAVRKSSMFPLAVVVLTCGCQQTKKNSDTGQLSPSPAEPAHVTKEEAIDPSTINAESVALMSRGQIQSIHAELVRRRIHARVAHDNATVDYLTPKIDVLEERMARLFLEDSEY